MKQVSLGGLDVSRLSLGAMGMSAFAEIANRGDHVFLLSPWLDVLAALLSRSGVPGPSDYESSRVSAMIVTDPWLPADAYLSLMKTVQFRN
jgi:hypothetical protein